MHTDLDEIRFEVLQAASVNPSLHSNIHETLRARARASPLKRCRVLLHATHDDLLQEMLICMIGPQHVQPHVHRTSAKSYIVLAGSITCITFSDTGTPQDVVRLASDQIFTLRFQPNQFHTVMPGSESVIFMETLVGPYRATEYATWAPPPHSEDAPAYYSELERFAARSLSSVHVGTE